MVSQAFLQLQICNSTIIFYLQASCADICAACSKEHCSDIAALTTASYSAGLSKHGQSSAATAALADVKTGMPLGETQSRCQFDTFVLPIRAFTADTAS